MKNDKFIEYKLVCDAGVFYPKVIVTKHFY